MLREIAFMAQQKISLSIQKQVVLKPREKRLIRVIWKAKKKLPEEKCYRITFAEQNINIDFGEEDLGKGERRAGLSFGVRFEGSVYIQPNDKGKAKIEVSEFNRRMIEGEEYFVVTIKNTGTRHTQVETKNLELELLAAKMGKKRRLATCFRGSFRKVFRKCIFDVDKWKKRVKDSL